MICLELLWTFFQIGLFSIGGGYAAIPLLQAKVVEANGWLTLSEFTDLVTIAEMTPGPIAVNSATFVGMRLAGIPGAVLATLGNILPGCVIVLLLSMLYRRYGRSRGLQTVLGTLRPAVVALIAGAALSIGANALGIDLKTASDGIAAAFSGFSWLSLVLLIPAFFALRKKANPILVIFATGAVYTLLQWMSGAL